jgi:Zn-dependent protease with chaperone function
MAYGSIFDKRIALIAEDYKQVPEDEVKGIIAHELAHTKGKHTLILTFITTGDLVFRMLFGVACLLHITIIHLGTLNSHLFRLFS